MGKWIERLEEFFNELSETFQSEESCLYFPDDNFLDAPITESEVQQLLERFGKIPESLLDFFRSECSCISFQYAVDSPFFFGGPMMSSFSRNDFFDKRHLHSTREFGQFHELLPIFSERTELAFNCVAIHHEVSGDALVLDVREGDDPPVYWFKYSAKIDAPLEPPIANSFTEFLSAWERLCYLDASLFEGFGLLDSNGRLDASEAVVARLREQVGLNRFVNRQERTMSKPD
jgi:hypothetical protein